MADQQLLSPVLLSIAAATLAYVVLPGLLGLWTPVTHLPYPLSFRVSS